MLSPVVVLVLVLVLLALTGPESLPLWLSVPLLAGTMVLITMELRRRCA